MAEGSVLEAKHWNVGFSLVCRRDQCPEDMKFPFEPLRVWLMRCPPHPLTSPLEPMPRAFA
jgi:hypothetical protein